MKEPAKMSRTAALVEGALMIALAFVLSMIPLFQYPWGGSITMFSTLPLVVMSFRHSTKWGVGTAAVYSILQMLQGMSSVLAVPAQNFLAMVMCALLDYILAYTMVGFSGTIARRFKKPTFGLVVGITATGLGRYLCSVLSGILVWGAYAWEGWSLWPYSIVYNAAWCLPDVAITLMAALLLSRVRLLPMVPPPSPTSQK